MQRAVKDGLLTRFYEASNTTEKAFAERCKVVRQTIQNAGQGRGVTLATAEKIAKGMGLLPTEAVLILEGNSRYSVDELIEISLQRLGLGLWGVCDHDFVRTERYLAIPGVWQGEQTQQLLDAKAGSQEMVARMTGEIRVVGRTLCGLFESVVVEPQHIDSAISLRTEGYWFGDNHYVAIYRFGDSAMPNFGTIYLTLSLCMTRLEGSFRGWSNPTNRWISGEVRLTRVANSSKKR